MIILRKTFGTLVQGKFECSECKRIRKSITKYRFSSIGTAFLCAGCKSRVLERSKKNISKSKVERAVNLAECCYTEVGKDAVILEKNYGKMVNIEHECAECGRLTQGLVKYKSQDGYVYICYLCKPTVLQRSFGGVDILNYALR